MVIVWGTPTLSNWTWRGGPTSPDRSEATELGGRPELRVRVQLNVLNPRSKKRKHWKGDGMGEFYRDTVTEQTFEGHSLVASPIAGPRKFLYEREKQIPVLLELVR